jgi:hypothetical protein
MPEITLGFRVSEKVSLETKIGFMRSDSQVAGGSYFSGVQSVHYC